MVNQNGCYGISKFHSVVAQLTKWRTIKASTGVEIMLENKNATQNYRVETVNSKDSSA